MGTTRISRNSTYPVPVACTISTLRQTARQLPKPCNAPAASANPMWAYRSIVKVIVECRAQGLSHLRMYASRRQITNVLVSQRVRNQALDRLSASHE